MKKHYCFTDLHGMYNLWEQIKNFCDENDIIYFLGDALDRGPDGIKIMKELLEDPRVVYLLGNHEQMLLDTYSCPSTTYLWTGNGGLKSLRTFRALSDEEQEKMYNTIKELPIHALYQNPNGDVIHMTHAGCTPDKIPENDCHSFLWDRKHFTDNWPTEYSSLYEVHGHTPVPYLALKLDAEVDIGPDESCNILRYADNHKIDLDLMSFESNKIALLDLDTLEPIYFYTKTD